MLNINKNLINPQSGTPLYKQVSHIISSEIERGNLKAGEKLPSELDLAKMLDVSRITIRSALTDLVSDNFLERIQGKGTFVAEKKQTHMLKDIGGFTESCLKAGKTSRSIVLFSDYIYPTEQERSFLNISEGSQVIEIRRLRFVNDKPTVLETIHICSDFSYLLNEDLSKSIFSILNTHNIRVHKKERTLEIATSTSEEASLLNIKKGTPLLMFKDYNCNQENTPIFISKQLYNMQNMLFYL